MTPRVNGCNLVPSTIFVHVIRVINFVKIIIINELTELRKCGKNAQCRRNKDTQKFACSCDDGFMGDGVLCQDINECLEDMAHGAPVCHVKLSEPKNVEKEIQY